MVYLYVYSGLMKKISIIMISFFAILSLAWCGLSDKIKEKIASSSNSTSTAQATPTEPYEIGEVDTAFQRVWPDHSIEIGAVPDPKVTGISCFYSRAKTGGIKWWLGLAEDTSDASVACRQTWPIVFKESIKDKEEIRHESTNLFFKKLRIVRFYDEQSNSLIYLVYSDKLIDGSPKNSISAIALNEVQPLLK